MLQHLSESVDDAYIFTDAVPENFVTNASTELFCSYCLADLNGSGSLLYKSPIQNFLLCYRYRGEPKLSFLPAHFIIINLPKNVSEDSRERRSARVIYNL